MKNKEIIDKIEEFAPLSLAEEWDNVGMLVGSAYDECKAVLLALDLTAEVAKEAVQKKCNLIITHHPIIFNGLNKIDTGNSQGEIIKTLMSAGISAYAAHTNLDKAEGGIGSKLANYMDGENIRNDGVGTIFTISEITLENFARKIAKKLADKSVKVVGDPDAKIKNIYVVSGGGGDLELFRRARCVADVFVTGDIKHHVYIEAQNEKFPLVEFSHYSSEIVAVDILYNLLKPQFSDLYLVKAKEQCPFRILEEL